MAKFENKKFIADAFVSRELRCAVVLEEYLAEINNAEATRYAIKNLQKFNKIFKDLKTLKNKEYIANLVIGEFEKKINRDLWVPEFVRTLLLNVIKTKFKTEILEYGKGKNIARKD
jgi:ribosomal protein S8